MPAHLWVAVVCGGCTQRQKNNNADRSKRDDEGQTGVASDTHALAHVNACRIHIVRIVTGVLFDSPIRVLTRIGDPSILQILQWIFMRNGSSTRFLSDQRTQFSTEKRLTMEMFLYPLSST